MNKNRKGFTLVELIVVVTIFGVILGAILNMIKPANNVYHDADATMESNVIGSGLIDYLDDELRYSTNVLVLYNIRIHVCHCFGIQAFAVLVVIKH